MQIKEMYMFRYRVSLLFCLLVEQRTDSSVPPESLSVPMEEDGASGHVTPAEDKSLPSEDASQPDEALDARVER